MFLPQGSHNLTEEEIYCQIFHIYFDKCHERDLSEGLWVLQ